MGHLMRTNSKWNTITTHFGCNYWCLYHAISIERPQIWKPSNHMIQHYRQTQLKRTCFYQLTSQSVLSVWYTYWYSHWTKRHSLTTFPSVAEQYVQIMYHILITMSSSLCHPLHPPSSTQQSFGCFIIHISWYICMLVCPSYLYTLNFH